MSIITSRRNLVAGTVGLLAGSALTGTIAAEASTADEVGAIPELARQWKKLDLAQILRKRAAFVSVSQNNSLYRPWGAQAGERHWERGSLPATVKAMRPAKPRTLSPSAGSATRSSVRTIRSRSSIKSSTRPG
jgi:hypothetical protein